MLVQYVKAHVMTRSSQADLLHAFLKKIGLEELRAQWQKTIERRLPSSPAIRQSSNQEAVGALDTQEFLTLVKHFASTHIPKDELHETDLAVAALDLLRLLDLRGDGTLSWNEFEAFATSVDLDIMASCIDAVRIQAPMGSVGANHSRSAVPRVKQYQYVAECALHEDFPNGLRKLEYLPPPVHRMFAIPRGVDGSELVHIITPELPPRISATLRHHSAYRAHRVLNATGVPRTEVIVTATSAGTDAHYLSLWSLPKERLSRGASEERGKAVRREGTLLPVLVHRVETDWPQTTVFASIQARLYSGGEMSGMVYEWELCRKERGADPVAIQKLRACRLHTFGITSIIEIDLKERLTNLLITGSSDGYISVWNPLEWSLPNQSATGVASNSSCSDCAGDGLLECEKPTPTTYASSRAPSCRKKMEPIIQLNAHAAGPAKLVLSHDHGLLFAAGCPTERDAKMAAKNVLVWKLADALKEKYRQSVYRTLHRHQVHVVDMVEISSEAHFVSADISGLVIVWNLPALIVQQELITSAAQRICCSRFPYSSQDVGAARSRTTQVDMSDCTSARNAAKQTTTLVVSTDRIRLYPCVLSIIREPLILAHFDAAGSRFVVVSTKRVCLWDAITGSLLSQVEAAVLFDGGRLKQSERRSARAANLTIGIVTSESLEDHDVSQPEITCASVSGTGLRLVVGDERGGVYVCSLPDCGQKPICTTALQPHEGISTVVCLLDSCEAVLSAGSDGVIGVHDKADSDGFNAKHPKPGIVSRLGRVRDVRIITSTQTQGEITLDSNSPIIEQALKKKIHWPASTRESLTLRQLTSGGKEKCQWSKCERSGPVRQGTLLASAPLPSDRQVAGCQHASYIPCLPVTSLNRRCVNDNANEASTSSLGQFDSEGGHGMRPIHSNVGTANVESSLEGDQLGPRGLSACHKHATYEVLCAIADTHLNLVASLTTRSGSHLEEVQVCIWDFELFHLIGTCISSSSDESDITQELESHNSNQPKSGKVKAQANHVEQTTGIAFISPYPLLASCTSGCRVHIWRVPDCTIVYTLAPTQTPSFITSPNKGEIGLTRSPLENVRVNTLKTSVCAENLCREVQSYVPVDIFCSKREKFCVVVVGGCDSGHVVFWGLQEPFFRALNCFQVPAVRRFSYNPMRQVHTLVNWSTLKLPRQTPRIVPGGGLGSIATPSDSCRATFRWWRIHEDATAIGCIQIIENPQVIMTGSDDGVARLWSWNGMHVGQLDINSPLGTIGRKGTHVSETARGWGFTMSAVAASPDDSEEKLREIDTVHPDVNFADVEVSQKCETNTLAAESMLSLTTTSEWISSQESAKDDSGPARMADGSFYRRIGRPSSKDKRSWDSVFDCMIGLEKREAQPRNEASMPRRGAVCAVPLQGKRWKTQNARAVPAALLVPHFASNAPTTSQTKSQPNFRAPLPRQDLRRSPSLSELARHRMQPIPRASKYERKKPFPDNDKRPLARITQLVHMGLL